MQCSNCKLEQSSSNKYCTKCGAKLVSINSSVKPTTPQKAVLLTFILCSLCLLWTLYVALFTPFWELPAFGGPGDPPDFYEPLKSFLVEMQEDYESDRFLLDKEDRIESADLLYYLDKFVSNPSIVCWLFIINKYSNDIEGSAVMIETLLEHLLLASALFIIATIIFIALFFSIRKNSSIELSRFIVPGIFCYYYNGILAVVIFSILSIVLTVCQEKRISNIAKGSP